MLNRCLLLFVITIVGMIIGQTVNDYFNSYSYKNSKLKLGILEKLSAALLVISLAIFSVTLVLSVYLFIWGLI